MDFQPDPVTIQQLPDASDMDSVDESEPDAEEEIDQLDSDSDAPPEQQPDTTNHKKPTRPKAGGRIPGQALIPAGRIENILQADGGLGNLNLSKEGTFILSIATEEFIKRLVNEAYENTSRENRNMVRYNDLAQTAQGMKYNFLSSIIPRAVPLNVALEFRESREQRLRQCDPALQGRPRLSSKLKERASKSLTPEEGRNIATENGLESRGAHLHENLPRVSEKSNTPSVVYNSRLEKRQPRVGANASKSQAAEGTLTKKQSSNSVSSASTSAINEPAQTWEEWKEKSRRLYGTGDDSRKKNPGVKSETVNDHRQRSTSREPSHTHRPREQEKQPHVLERSSNGLQNHSPAPKGMLHLLNGDSGPSTPPILSSSHCLNQSYSPPAYVSPFNDRPWPSQLTGPGSALLHGPGGPFPPPPPRVASPVGHVSPRLGRPIYSLNDSLD